MPAMNGMGPNGAGMREMNRRGMGCGWGFGRGMGFCRLTETAERERLTEARNCLQSRLDEIDRRLKDFQEE